MWHLLFKLSLYNIWVPFNPISIFSQENNSFFFEFSKSENVIRIANKENIIKQDLILLFPLLLEKIK